jgi:hypothetical protein
MKGWVERKEGYALLYRLAYYASPGMSLAILYNININTTLDDAAIWFPPVRWLLSRHYTNDKALASFIEQLFSSVQILPALIAQLVERVTSNDEVAGSTPS